MLLGVCLALSLSLPNQPGEPLAPPDRESCDEVWGCGDGEDCVDGVCVPSGPKTRQRAIGPRTVRLGISNSLYFGFAGAMKNPRPSYSFGADFGFPTGQKMRFHVEVGYQDINGYDGLRFNPLVLGFEIPAYQFDSGVSLEVEILAAIVQSEILFNEGYSISLSSGLRAQLVVAYDIGYAALAPLGFEIRYAQGIEDIGIRTGVGANWPLALIIGVEL